mmetsp:Transcript_5019/g.6801  ORF Transcript_5019/g.6801 Transcript_5019/m.6801 type:complete len:383 (-) Transcript_5019:173-1321(-)|eukprot:CAMPEP_0116053082 /NCGR_PEP_ID=MMETSP0322-20121206/1967_1 /TAXON_ID=163516 /ORGANISM="Leptocylindrus danicus var. apora, Strain B651" /LENGTH=382 /DNA_ID=CAMNT_0003536161 /DNA_START=234 /DNA_END=1382 /DNA_ORIENTATION=-
MGSSDENSQVEKAVEVEKKEKEEKSDEPTTATGAEDCEPTASGSGDEVKNVVTENGEAGPTKQASAVIDQSVFSNNKRTFPEKLMALLASDDARDVVVWLPDGKSFTIIKPEVFVNFILPKYFKQAQLSSFVRRLHRWGFRQLKKETGESTYEHDLFLRDDPDLCLQMCCTSYSLSQKRKSKIKQEATREYSRQIELQAARNRQYMGQHGHPMPGMPPYGRGPMPPGPPGYPHHSYRMMNGGPPLPGPPSHYGPPPTQPVPPGRMPPGVPPYNPDYGRQVSQGSGPPPQGGDRGHPPARYDRGPPPPRHHVPPPPYGPPARHPTDPGYGHSPGRYPGYEQYPPPANAPPTDPYAYGDPNARPSGGPPPTEAMGQAPPRYEYM